MRSANRIIAFVSAAILCAGAVSCKKDPTLQYNNLTMGNVTEGVFTSDQGNIFNVVDQSCYGRLDTMKRAIILCDVLNKTTGGLENEYDVRLTAMSPVRVKDIILDGKVEDITSSAEENNGESTEEGTDEGADQNVYREDPVTVSQVWISGGYINMYVTLPYKQSSKTIHEINLVKTETKDGYEFRLVHNANGETMTDSTMYDFVEGGGYFSFPISSIITEDEADVRIVWKWYRTLGTSIDINTTGFYFTEFTYKKGYEHIPAGLSLASTVRAM